MNIVKWILLGLILSTYSTEIFAANKYVNNMTVLNANEDSDTAEIEMKGNGESCKLSFGSDGVIYSTSCGSIVNSKGLKIYCTSNKKLCKTYDEIYTFIFNPRPEAITFRGVISDSAIELDNDGAIWFSPESNNARMIFDSCKSDDYCEIVGVVNDGFLVSVSNAKKIDKGNAVATNSSITPIKSKKKNIDSSSANITWKDLGIGIDNPGEIKDWTYFGIKTPKEASEWISALKPLGGISYAGAARIWKQNGFSAKEVKGWVLVGAKTPEYAKYWTNIGIPNAQEAQKWKDTGITTAQLASQWIQAGIGSLNEIKQWQEIGINDVSQYKDWKRYVDNPVKAKEWIDASYSINDVALQVRKGNLSPSDVISNKDTSADIADEETMHKDSFGQVSTEHRNVQSILNENIDKSNSMAALPFSQTSNQKNLSQIQTNYNSSSSSSSAWQLFLLVYFIVMIVTMFKGYGENRTVIIFRDYNDLGLTFLIPASFVLIFYLYMMFGGNPAWGMGLAFIVSASLFVILAKNTYTDNNQNMLPTVLSIMTKVPLGIIWILSFMTMLNPGGKTAKQRRENRGIALVIMGILTPIIGMLVVEKEGSKFNPKDWIKGRRIGSIRNHL